MRNVLSNLYNSFSHVKCPYSFMKKTWRCGTKFYKRNTSWKSFGKMCAQPHIFIVQFLDKEKQWAKATDCLWDYGINLFYNSMGLGCAEIFVPTIFPNYYFSSFWFLTHSELFKTLAWWFLIRDHFENLQLTDKSRLNCNVSAILA